LRADVRVERTVDRSCEHDEHAVRGANVEDGDVRARAVKERQFPFVHPVRERRLPQLDGAPHVVRCDGVERVHGPEDVVVARGDAVRKGNEEGLAVERGHDRPGRLGDASLHGTLDRDGVQRRGSFHTARTFGASAAAPEPRSYDLMRSIVGS